MSYNTRFSLAALCAMCIMLSGCAPKTTVTLLPEDGGKVGTIEYADSIGKTHRINRAWQSLDVSENGSVSEAISNKETIMGRYKETLAALPQKPSVFRIFFPSESAGLDKEDIAVLNDAIHEITAKHAIEVVCAGHADATGDREYNRLLSMRRALAAANYLIRNGVAKDIIETRYYGDADPLVHTAPGKSNQKNRRVEIIVK